MQEVLFRERNLRHVEVTMVVSMIEQIGHYLIDVLPAPDEAALVIAAHAAGVKAPEVVGVLSDADGMGTGAVDINWAKEHHSLWVQEEQAKGRAPDTGSPRAMPAE